MQPSRHPTPEELAELSMTTDNVIRSAYGNAIFSGLSVEVIWECFRMTKTAEEFDEHITAAICAKEDLEEIVKGDRK